MSLPLYVAGFLLTWLLNYQPYSLRRDLGSYAGLVVDAFLFPQTAQSVHGLNRTSSFSVFLYGNHFNQATPSFL